MSNILTFCHGEHAYVRHGHGHAEARQAAEAAVRALYGPGRRLLFCLSNPLNGNCPAPSCIALLRDPPPCDSKYATDAIGGQYHHRVGYWDFRPLGYRAREIWFRDSGPWNLTNEYEVAEDNVAEDDL